MPLSDDQLALIRQSFDVLRHDPQPATAFFYEDLFRRAPELRQLFRDDLAGQGMKFMSTLAVIVDNLHEAGALAERYTELGAQHRRLGVTAPMFTPMGEALLATIENALADSYTLDVGAAWRVAYADMAEAMIEMGEIQPK